MNYIAIDTHISTLNFAVINEKGRLTVEKVISTGEKGLIEFIKSIPKPRKVYIEEGTLASWILETCVDYGEKLIITDPKRNRWIAKSGQKNDYFDAKKLAQLARGAYIKEIHHPTGERRRFKELVLAYHDMLKNNTRIKNKLKAKFRQNGISCQGEKVYLIKYRQEWIDKLPDNQTVRFIVEGLWDQLDNLQKNIELILKQLKMESKKYPEIKRFQAIAGIGFIHSMTVSAILETPHRFSNKKKIWMYAGFGIISRSSGEKIYSTKLTKDYNRLLKHSIKQAAHSAVSSVDNQFRKQFLKLTIKDGMLPYKAILTVARSMLAVIYGMWKNNERYDPERINLKNNS